MGEMLLSAQAGSFSLDWKMMLQILLPTAFSHLYGEWGEETKHSGNKKLCCTLVITLSSSLQMRNDLSGSPCHFNRECRRQTTPKGVSTMQHGTGWEGKEGLKGYLWLSVAWWGGHICDEQGATLATLLWLPMHVCTLNFKWEAAHSLW